MLEDVQFKMEISGTQARVYLGEARRPALAINDLKRGAAKGFLGLKVTGPAGLTYFSDFKYRHDDSLCFDPPPRLETPLGMITSWELSPPVKFSRIDVKQYPSAKMRGRLYVGFGSDASVRTIDLASGEMKTIATLEPGAIVDGMETDSRGNVYVSDFRGKVYRIAPDGQKTLLLDVTGPKEYCANFAYVPDRNLLVIPTLVDNRIIAYRVPQ